MSEAPERIWMDPDIKFPECEKQYGCDVEYIRADLYEELEANRLAYVIATEAADRIEELQAQRNFAQKQVVMAEAKLAKAVEAIEFWSQAQEPEIDAAINLMQATLAELKGERT